jgi:hypothetical protein
MKKLLFMLPVLMLFGMFSSQANAQVTIEQFNEAAAAADAEAAATDDIFTATLAEQASMAVTEQAFSDLYGESLGIPMDLDAWIQTVDQGAFNAKSTANGNLTLGLTNFLSGVEWKSAAVEAAEQEIMLALSMQMMGIPYTADFWYATSLMNLATSDFMVAGFKYRDAGIQFGMARDYWQAIIDTMVEEYNPNPFVGWRDAEVPEFYPWDDEWNE